MAKEIEDKEALTQKKFSVPSKQLLNIFLNFYFFFCEWHFTALQSLFPIKIYMLILNFLLVCSILNFFHIIYCTLTINCVDFIVMIIP